MGLTGEIGQEPTDLWFAHFCDRSWAMKSHEPLYPATVCLLCVDTEMSGASGNTHLLQKLTAPRHCLTAYLGIRELSVVRYFGRTKQRLDFHRVTDKERQQVIDGFL